jgi:hypothetical protein
MRVRFLHPLKGIFQCRIPSWQATGKLMGAIYPTTYSLRRSQVVGPARVQTYALEHYQAFNSIRINTSVERRNGATHGMSDQSQRCKLGLVHQLRDVIDIIEIVITSPFAPFRVSMATQVRCDQVIVPGKVLGEPVPGVAVVLNPVQKQHGGLVRVTPIQIVQPQAFGKIAV